MQYKRTPLILFLILVLFLSACAPANQPAAETEEPTAPMEDSSAPPEEMTTIKIAMRPSLSYGPILIADAEGYFAEQGLQVEYESIRTGESIIAMQQGELDVAAAFFDIGAFNAMAQGENIKIVANRGYLDPEGCSYFNLMVDKGLFDSGELTSIADLEGMKISSSTDNYAGFMLFNALAQAGLTFADVEPVDIPRGTEIVAMQDGAVQAVSNSEPDTSLMINAGVGVVLVEFQDILPNDTWGVVIFGKNLLEDNPDAGRRFMVAYLKGVRQFNEGKTDRNLDILADAIEIDRAILEQACWPPVRSDGSMDMDSIMNFQMWAQGQGLLDTIATEEQVWDSSFVDYANEVLP